jgi:hypothetical protein
MGFALFWDVTQNMVIIPYRRLGTTILEFMTLEDGTSQKSANLIYFEVEARNHVRWYVSFQLHSIILDNISVHNHCHVNLRSHKWKPVL